MNKRIKNILRCYAAGIGIKETASTFHISRNTVRKYVRLFLSSGKSIEQLLSLPNGQLDELFGCTDTRHREPSSKRIELEALLPGYVSRLSRKGMSVRKLFKEYHTEYPDGYQLSSFKRIVSEYRFHIKVVGHVEHYAAEQMYIDFAGDRLEVVDEMTGETKKAEVFVAILPFSHYTYCEAVWSQRKEDLIKACENAIQYFEGVPAAIVPDNLKAAVTRSDRNEPVINDDFAAFAEYYGCVVYPARVRHPKDKALVENAVKLLYRSIYLDIEGMTFSSLEELNTAIHISLLDFNEKVMAGREMSRKEIFLHGEKDYLRPLPVKRYVMKERKLMTVGKNSYVSLFKHHYSVPKEYVGRRMTILYDADTVEIYCGMNLVATHDRCDIPYTYSWKKEHNLPGHYGPYDKDLEELFQRASEIDNIVLNYLQEVERVMQYPPKAFRSCRGIMTLEKKYGRDRLVAALAEAFRESLAGTTPQSMTADTFLSMLLAREWDYRSQAAIARLTKNAAFRYKAYIEQIDYATNRGLDRNQMERLATLDFVHKAQNLFITGSSGTGKSYLACALGHEACKRGFRTFYANAPKLLGALKVAKVKGTLEAELKKIERCQLLILDDLFIVPLDAKERPILLEIIEDRHERKSVIITSQYPSSNWYDMVGDPTIADAILDRIIHTAHTIELYGESMRKLKSKKNENF